MFDFFNKMRGSALVTVSGAFPEGILNACAQGGIELMSVQRLDDYTLRLRIPYARRQRLEQLAERCQCVVLSSQPGGVAGAGKLMRRRVLPLLCLAVLGTLLLWSKLYIWEIGVTGNETVETGKILAALEECGVGIGSYWPGFTSDNIRSEALVKLPELRWLTVNIYGSRAEVIVRERVDKPEMYDDSVPADVVAEKDGFIMEIRTLKGRSEVRRGQAVTEGQRLISGAVADIRGEVRTVYALGEVTARTYYELSAVMPLETVEKQYTGQEASRWSLVLGDERINFYGNSSIYADDCDKIYSVYKLEIPGLFSLPVSLQRESCRYYDRQAAESDAYLCRLALEQRLHQRLLEETEGGEIISEHYSCSEKDGLLTVCLRAECEEDIARTQTMDEARLWEARQTEKIEELS